MARNAIEFIKEHKSFLLHIQATRIDARNDDSRTCNRIRPNGVMSRKQHQNDTNRAASDEFTTSYVSSESIHALLPWSARSFGLTMFILW